jgi:hypothetical protein
MNKRIIVKIVLASAAMAASFILAGAGYGIFYEKLGIRTPGIIASRTFVPPKPNLASLGEDLTVQLLVDWVFWFAVVCLLYWLFGWLGRKVRKP